MPRGYLCGVSNRNSEAWQLIIIIIVFFYHWWVLKPLDSVRVISILIWDTAGGHQSDHMVPSIFIYKSLFHEPLQLGMILGC